jgi:hypothetical protein
MPIIKNAVSVPATALLETNPKPSAPDYDTDYHQGMAEA